MDDPETADFADTVTRYVDRSGYTTSQLARLAGVPRTTLVNWREGQVKKPHAWQDVVKLAQALRLDQMEADELLGAANYPTISRLRAQTQGEREPELLSFWAEKQTPLEPPPLPGYSRSAHVCGQTKRHESAVATVVSRPSPDNLRPGRNGRGRENGSGSAPGLPLTPLLARRRAVGPVGRERCQIGFTTIRRCLRA